MSAQKPCELLEIIDHVPGYTDEEVAGMIAAAECGEGFPDEMPLNGPGALLFKLHPEARRLILQVCDDRGCSIEDALIEVLNAQFAA